MSEKSGTLLVDIETGCLNDWMKPKSSYDMLFHPFREIQYEEVEFDFKIDPDHFLKWLEAEEQEVIGDYAQDVSSMCEYSCLYVAMMLAEMKLESTPVIYYGHFGFWEHYWIGYIWKGQEYFVDLTLAQFLKTAPKVAISKAINELDGYSHKYPGQLIHDYLIEKRAFEFYINPKTIQS